MKTIRQMCVDYGCDKAPEICHCYARHYDRLLKGLKPKKILEIGIGTTRRMNEHVNLKKRRKYEYITGVSLFIWAEYFPDAQIYGIDIEPEAMFRAPRITTVLGDSTDKAFAHEFINKYGPFDLIIDDGSHKPQDQFRTAQAFLPAVAPGGLYFVEDVVWPRTFYKRHKQWNPEILSAVRGDSLLLLRP